MGAQNDGSWREKQQLAGLMAKTAPAGQRGIQLGQVRCVKCNDSFTAVYIESTGRALLVGGKVQQSYKRLRFFCFTCNWGGTPEDAQRWLAEHKAEVLAKEGEAEAPAPGDGSEAVV